MPRWPNNVLDTMTAKEAHEYRLSVVQAVTKGQTILATVEQFCVSQASVVKWLRQYRQGGPAALIVNRPGKPKGKPKPQRKPWRYDGSSKAESYMPTPEQIAEATARIREGWSETVHQSRWQDHRTVEWVAPYMGGFDEAELQVA